MLRCPVSQQHEQLNKINNLAMIGRKLMLHDKGTTSLTYALVFWG
jgi:hypothetical protein